MALAAPGLSASCLVFVFLVPLAGAGLALINAGLGRSRSAAHSMLTAMAVLAVGAITYFAFGFGFQGYLERPAHVITVAGSPWNWLAAEPFFFRRLALDGSPASLAALLSLLGAGLIALIPLGAGADRWRLSASCASSAILAGWTFPLFAHWVWGGGWLAQLGTLHGMGTGLIDAGGSGTIQAVGGLTALSIAWIVGPRRGKYMAENMPAAIPGHNAVFVLFGSCLALLGWLGLNAAGAMLFTGAGIGRVVLVAVNTILSASGGVLAAVITTRLRFGKPDASLSGNGWMSGLVASSAGCALLGPAAALVTGIIAGVLVTLSVEFLETRVEVDDPGGAVSVHAVGGIWGLLAVAVFAGGNGQWLAQVVGVATLVGFVLPMTYGLNWLLDRVHPQRVSPEGERLGMDLHELGAGAYPEFMTHTEDFLPR
jgi:Amt family ammonium transporter